VPDWQFEWGNQTAGDPGCDFTGPAGAGYTTSGVTAADGTVSMTVPVAGVSSIHVREVLKPGYIPFTYDQTHQSNANNVSAEISCGTDGLNYDNYDFINNPQADTTYYCVAYNVQSEVTPPPTDLCSNIPENQSVVPDGYVQNEDGTCSPVDNGGDQPTDLCLN